MRKVFVFIMLTFVAAFSAAAQKAWTIETVPNTRLQSNNIHVSDPDDYLTDVAEMHINTALCSIRDSVDVFLVCLSTIGDEDPADFRSRLFNYWGIGDKGKNNGLLMLFIEDVHAFEFETGYGIEPVLPDIKCFEIFNHTMLPLFKEGDYDSAMYAGVLDIVEVFGGTVPEELVTDLPDEQVYDELRAEKDKEIMSSFYVWFCLFLFAIPACSFLSFLANRKDDKKVKKDGSDIKDTYSIKQYDGLMFINEPGTSWSGSAWQGGGCARSLTFGLSAIVWFFVTYVVLFALMKGEEEIVIRNWIAVVTIIGYFSWICIRHNRRTIKMADKVAKDSLIPRSVYDKAKNYRRTQWVNILAFWIGWYYRSIYEDRKKRCPEMFCPECHEAMNIDETPAVLPAREAAELANEARRFVSLRCPNGHAFIIKEKGKRYKSFTNCDHCGAHLLKKESTKVIKVATYDHTGLDEVTYVCLFCKEKIVKEVVVPRREHSSSGGGHSSGGSSSRSSGGSFGGGRSGGGGYSGRW